MKVAKEKRRYEENIELREQEQKELMRTASWHILRDTCAGLQSHATSLERNKLYVTVVGSII